MFEAAKEVHNFRSDELANLVMNTKPYIKPEKFDDWKKLCAKNSFSTLNINVIKMLDDMMVAISNGKSYDEIISKICSDKHDATGSMIEWAISCLREYSIFEEELSNWYGGENYNSKVSAR